MATFKPRSNHIHCKETGKIIEYWDLIQIHNKDLWEEEMCRELGRLAQGGKYSVTVMDTIKLIYKSEIQMGRKDTYVRAV